MRKVTLKINQALKMRGMTQKELAELTGLRPSAISRLARAEDVDRVSLEHLTKIVTALNISNISELMTVEEECEDA